MPWPQKPGYGFVKVSGNVTIRQSAYDFYWRSIAGLIKYRHLIPVPQRGPGAQRLVGTRGQSPRKRGSGAEPQKLSSFAYLAANFARVFAHAHVE